MQEILGAGTAQVRAAVLHHHLAIDVAGGIGNQETCEIGKLAMLADAAERIFRRPSFVAALGPKLTGRAFTVPSAMAKAAVLAMTKSLAVEWGPKGIRTVAIAPGAFPTPGASGQLRPQGRDENWASRNPLGRVGEHRELADLASFLVSDSAGYINGEMVVQDGGAHLRSSGAEDLLQWTDAQWQKQRERRPKG